MGKDRGYIISDENYQQQARAPVDVTLKVVEAAYGLDWRKGALAQFQVLEIIAADLDQWARYGCPLWVLADIEAGRIRAQTNFHTRELVQPTTE